MKKVKSYFISALFFASAAVFAGDLVWDSAESFTHWKDTRNVRAKIENNTLKLSDIGADPSLGNRSVNIKPGEFNAFVYTYRAKGTSKKSGQLFFAPQGKRFAAQHFFTLPPMTADGKYHTAVVDFSKQHPDVYKTWSSLPNIGNLRFDITDGAGGEIEIIQLKLVKTLSANPTALVWNSQNKFSGWDTANNAVMNNTGKTLELTLVKRDSQLVNDRVSFAPRSYNSFSYRYRARGTSNLGGQLFYAVDGENYKHDQYWILPRLIADGQWHTVTLSDKSLNKPDSWFKAKLITRLRFDPSDGAGGTVEIAELKFSKLDRKAVEALNKNTAAGFAAGAFKIDAPVWKAIKNGYTQQDYKVKGSYYKGDLISADEDLQPGEPRAKKTVYSDFFLRREFELKSKAQKAFLQMIADDSAQIYINGKKAAAVNTWQVPVVKEVTAYLKPGKNIWAVHYKNSDAVGGVFGELFVQTADDSVIRINTDEKFLSTVVPPDNWNLADCPLENFKKVKILPQPPHPPWREQTAYIEFECEQKILQKNIFPRQASAGSKVKLSMQFAGKKPEQPFEVNMRLTKNDLMIWREKVQISMDMIKVLGNGKWQLEFDYQLPMYINSADAVLNLTSSKIYLPQEKLDFSIKVNRLAVAPGYEKTPVCKVKSGAYGPYFELNGKPFYYVSGNMNTFIYGNPPTNTVTVGPNSFDWWKGENKYDFEVLDYYAERARRGQGDCYFIWNMTMYIPLDILKKLPGATALDENGKPVYYNRFVNGNSYSSREVLDALRTAMLKAIEYLEKSPYANRIIGYRINGGHTIEWLGWQKDGYVMDFSEKTRQGFIGFAKKHYPELKNPRIPTLSDRRNLDNNELIWDPQKHLSAIAFHEYYSSAIADYVIDLTRAAKKQLKNKKLVGTYYGYTMTLNCNGRSQMRGHFALKKLLDAKSLDFLMSPQPYNVRNFGDTYGDMKPFATMKNNNIVSFQEDDTRTHLSNGYIGFYQSPNEDMTTRILRRGMGFTLCRNMPSLNIAMPGHYDYPQAHIDYPILQKVGQHCLEKQVKRNAQIALVVSEKSVCYSPIPGKSLYTGTVVQTYGKDRIHRGNVRNAPFVYSSFGDNYTFWSRTGAAVDYLLAEDLADNPGNYKLYVFVNCQVYDEKFQQAIRKLQQRECTLLWMYAPGYTFNNQNSVENMYNLTGLQFKKLSGPVPTAVTMKNNRIMGYAGEKAAPFFAVTDPNAKVHGRYADGSAAIAEIKTGNAKTIFCGSWLIDLEFCRNIAESARVRTFSRSGDPVEANDALVALHARFPGKKTIELPGKTTVLDVFNKKILARNADKFEFEASLHSSWLFYYGDDAEALLKKLESKR